MLEPAIHKKQAIEHSPTGKTFLPWVVWFFIRFSGLANCKGQDGLQENRPFLFPPLFFGSSKEKRG